MTDLERAARDWYTLISTEATVGGKIHALAQCLAAARREPFARTCWERTHERFDNVCLHGTLQSMAVHVQWRS